MYPVRHLVQLKKSDQPQREAGGNVRRRFREKTITSPSVFNERQLLPEQPPPTEIPIPEAQSCNYH